MSMFPSFSRTPKHKYDTDAPAKTPGGWKSVLGIATTTKKEPPPDSVGASTASTRLNGGMSHGANASGLTSRDNAGSPDIGDYQSPAAALQFSPEGRGAFSIGTSPTRGGRKKPSRLQFSALSSRNSLTNDATTATGTPARNRVAFGADVDQSGVRNSRSPWRGASSQLTTTTAEPSVWQGSRNRSNEVATSTSLSFLSNSTSGRARRYRPNSGLLTGSKGGRRYRRTGKLDEEKFGKALAGVRDTFLLPYSNQDSSTNVYSTKGGIRWGSMERPSRIPQAVHKRQRPAQRMKVADSADEDDDFEGERSRKRRKKVSFNEDDDDAVMTNTVATPHGSKGRFRRKATPMPKKEGNAAFGSPASTVDDDEDDEVIAPSLQRRDNLPTAPARLELNFGSLNSDAPVPLSFPSGIVTSYDPTVPDPAACDLKFGSSDIKSASTSEGMVSTESKSEYDKKRYDRPLSPVLRRGIDTPDDTVPGQAQKRLKLGDNKDEEVVPDWVCDNCQAKNSNDESKCLKCETYRKSVAVAGGWGNLFDDFQKDKWKCPACSSFVDNSKDQCQACNEKRPADVGTNAAAAPSPTPNNSSAAPASKSFAFGKPTPNLPVPTGPAPENKFEFKAPSPGAAAPASTGGFKFEAPKSSASGTGSGGFLFQAPQASKEGKPATAPTASSAAVGGFIFGGTAVPASGSNAVGLDAAKQNGTTASASKMSANAKTFSPAKRTGENGDKKLGGSPKNVQFGLSESAGSGAGKGNFGFGTDSTSKSQSTSAPAPFAFGSTNGGSAEEKKSQIDPPAPAPFVFGKAPAGSESKSSEPAPGSFTFGSAAASSSGEFSTSFGTNQASTSAPSKSSMSEQKPKRQRGYDLSNGEKTKAAKTPTSSGAALFGAPASAAPKEPASGGTNAFKFGSASGDAGAAVGNTPAAPFGNSSAAPSGGLQFGASDQTSSNGTSNSFTFGASSSQAPAPAPTTGFGPAAQATTFGSIPAPAPAVPVGGFGAAPASATTFGVAPAPATTFGSGPAPAFGAGTTPAPGVAFGAAPAPTPGFGFGAASSTGFGSANPPAATPGAPTFGAPSNTPATSFGAPGFGSQTPAANQGFNSAAFGNGGAASSGFGTANAAPNSTGAFGTTGFGAPPGGGFASTPVPAGGFGGGGFGAAAPQAPSTAPNFGAAAPQAPSTAPNFSIGTSGTKQRRRMVRAKRPTRPA
ncbi:ZnF_RBZ [Seminavis robusta]|uniref:ZnF_RBZ n=1 Tax=Seminavis robusta TaxID=568900 RepID=A0A9N8E4P6_9STRA|nr:ZnF_RBZ [Seminavis robusta]|eukprot:Sro498_g154940.1 ZnF_RBZ (1202) ;mRNA; f:50359-53964